MSAKKAPAVPVCKTKSDIIAAIAEKTELTKVQVKAVLDFLPELVLAGAKDGFTLPGLGKFSVLVPATKTRKMKMMLGKDKGKVITIKTSKSLRFKPAKAVKEAINK